MLALLPLLTLAWLPAQEPVQHELQLYAIPDLINVRAERRQAFEQRLALDLVTVALRQPDKDAGALDSVGRLMAGALLDQAVKQAEPTSESLDRLGVLGMLLESQLPDTLEPFQSADELLDNVRKFMQPPFDPGVESLKVDQAGEARVLLAYLQPAQHQWLAQFFDFQRQRDDWQVMLKAEFYVGKGSVAIRDSMQGNQALPLSNTSQIDATRKLIIENNYFQMSAPSIMTVPGRAGELSVQQKFSYVSGWEVVTVHPGERKIADPVIDEVNDGLELAARALQATDNLYGLEINATLTEVVFPQTSQKITVEGMALEVTKPKLTVANISTSLLLPDGGGVLLLSRDFKPGKDLLLLIQFERLQAP
jgi:hypothetical protein